MKYFLIVDELKYAPGLYGSFHTKKEFDDKFKSFKDDDEIPAWGWLLLLSVGLPFFIPTVLYYTFFSKKDKIIPLMPESFENKFLPPKDNITPYFRNCILVPSIFLKSYDDYKNKIFYNAFQSSDHLSTLLPCNSGNELIIMSTFEANNYFVNSKIELGLNAWDIDNNSLIPLQNFSIKKWDIILSNIFICFRNLGAKEISFQQTEETSIISDVNIKKICAKFGTEYERNYKFSFTRIMNDSVYNPEIAQNNLISFEDECPLIYQSAKDAIVNKPTGSLEREEIVDLKFRLSLDVLGAFQGSFKGGFIKKFKIKINF